MKFDSRIANPLLSRAGLQILHSGGSLNVFFSQGRAKLLVPRRTGFVNCTAVQDLQSCSK
jgi:hypothetical protein